MILIFGFQMLTVMFMVIALQGLRVTPLSKAIMLFLAWVPVYGQIATLLALLDKGGPKISAAPEVELVTEPQWDCGLDGHEFEPADQRLNNLRHIRGGEAYQCIHCGEMEFAVTELGEPNEI